MKILFVRHGESVDDLTDQYGGWADFHLTPKGKIQLQQTSEKIKDLNIKFEYLYSSPLWRAEESGRIIANLLSIPLEISGRNKGIIREFFYYSEEEVKNILREVGFEIAELESPVDEKWIHVIARNNL